MAEDNVIFIGERPPRADAIRNRRRLLDVARRLFDEQGVEVVTMSAIAQQAEVGKGTLYRHFPDKATLCHAMLDEAMRDFQQETLLILRNTPNPHQAMRWFLRRAVEFVSANIELLNGAATSGEAPMLQHPAHYWWRTTIRSLLVRSAIEGDCDYLADALYIMLDVRTIAYQRQAQGYPLARIIDGLYSLLDALTGPVN